MDHFILPRAAWTNGMEIAFRMNRGEGHEAYVQIGRDFYEFLRKAVPWGVLDGIRQAVHAENEKNAAAFRPAKRRVTSPRRFENKRNGHNKFWEIGIVDPQTYEVRYGAIGTEGARSRKHFATRGAMSGARFNKVAEKLGRGYVEVFGAEPWEIEG